MLGNPDIIQTQKKFYQNKVHFTKFKDLTEERMEELNKEVDRLKEVKEKERLEFNKYNRILKALIYTNNLTFDEKAYILIKVMDPELTIYNYYHEANIIPRSEIDEEDNDFVKRNLAEERNKQLDAYKAKVREKIGFFQNELFSIESVYYKKFLVNNLVFGNKLDESKKLFDVFKGIEDIEIAEERLNEVIALADDYTAKYPDVNFKDFVYHVLYRGDILGIKGIKETIIFCINVLDKDLRLYQIYEVENKWEDIEKKCKNEVGIKNRNFIYLECNYVKTYLPEVVEKYTF